MSSLPAGRAASRWRAVSLGFVIVLIVAACGSATPSIAPSAAATATTAPASSSPVASGSPSAIPSAEIDATYDAIEAQVVAIRGLQSTKPVERQVIDESQLRTMLTQQLDEETPPAYLAANERFYKALGLMPLDADLRDLTLELLSGGVVGFYRNDQGKLYVVAKSGAPGVNERFTFSHEYDHALQDQNFPVFKDQKDVLDQGDWLLARQAVYEGDATLLMTYWAATNLSQADLTQLIALSNDPETAALMARMPPILRDTLTYPYTTGFFFVQQAQAAGGWSAVDKLYEKLPESTEQILHPEKYAAAEAPVKVALPTDLAIRLGKGWTVPLEDTFGELQTGIWLAAGDPATPASTAAAAGWGGDRLAVINGPNGAWAVAMHTVWDTTKDATEFETAANLALRKADGVSGIVPGAGGKHRWVVVANDATKRSLVQNVLGLAG
jgi:hypothetical protein